MPDAHVFGGGEDRRGGNVAVGDRALGRVRRRRVESLGPLGDRDVASLAHVVDDFLDRHRFVGLHGRTHGTIRSMGKVKIELAPAASSLGNNDQMSAAGTSACTATTPGVARSITEGDPVVGSTAVTSSRRSFDTLQSK